MINNGLVFIPNQPIRFDINETSCITPVGKKRNQQFLKSDPIEFQIKRSPCGLNLVCADNTGVLGDEMITNGTFTGSATGWDYGGGSPWIPGTNNMTSIGTNDELLWQDIPSLVAGKRYRISFQIVTIEEGALRVQLGQGAGAITSEYYDTAGTKTVDLYFSDIDADKMIAFSGDGFIGEIDNVSIKPITYCYDGPGWVGNEDGTYQHLVGYNTALEAITDPITQDNIYAIKVQVTGMTEGSVVVNIGTSAGADILKNGVYPFYLDAGAGTGVNIIPTEDFDGVVEILELYEQTELSYIYLVNEAGDEVADLSSFVNYVADRINVRFTANDLADRGLIEAGVVPDGCYRIAVEGICNPANSNLAPNPTMSGGTTLALDGWSKNNGSSQYDFTGGVVKFKYSGSAGEVKSPILYSDEIPALEASDLELTIEISSNSDTDNIAVYAKVDNYKDAVTPTKFTSVGTHTVVIPGYDPNGIAPPNKGNRRIYISADFQYDGAPTPGDISITFVDLRPVSEDATTNYSQKFEIKESLECLSKWVVGSGYCYGYGFDFRQFELGQRVPVMLFNPVYPVKQSSYLFTNGNKIRTSGERDKKYKLRTDYIDEVTSDCFSLQLICDRLEIDGQEYFFEGKEVTPKGRTDGRSAAAQVEIELTPQGSVVSSNLCGDCDAAPSFIPCAVFYESAIDFVSNPSTAGWYMTDGENTLEYYNGSAFIGSPVTGEGYVDCLMDGSGSISYSGPYRWNSVANDWEALVALTGIIDDTNQFTVQADILNGCAARVEVSTNAGVTWTGASPYVKASDIATGVVAIKPEGGVPFRFRIVIKCAICTYESVEITLYE
jgi:hypothetical protein